MKSYELLRCDPPAGAAAPRVGLVRMVSWLLAASVAVMAGVWTRAPQAAGTASTWSAAGPALAADFPDPAVIETPSGWYAYGTNAGGRNVPVARSEDLVTWEVVGDALPAESFPAWAQIRDRTWAPGVVMMAPDRYLLYVSVPTADTGRQCIAVLAAATPQGPFTDAKGGPLFCGWEDSNGAIDPQPMRSLDGRLFLYTKDVASAHQLWGHQLSADGLSIPEQSSQFLLTADAAWEAGGIENPTMVATSTGWWLLYSGNWWSSTRYGVGAARCSGPLGPCDKVTTQVPWLSSASGYGGPGGQSLAIRHDGEVFLVFHAWDEAGEARQLHAAPMSFLGDVPTMGSPPPEGWLQVSSDDGVVTVRGVVRDPSTTEPVTVVIAAEAPVASAVTDPVTGSVAVSIATDGSLARWCATALNNATGANTSLGCHMVNPPEGPWPHFPGRAGSGVLG